MTKIGKVSFAALLGLTMVACNSEPQPMEVPTEEPVETGEVTPKAAPGSVIEQPEEDTASNENEQAIGEITEFNLEIDLTSNEKIDVEFEKEREEDEFEYKVRGDALKGAEAQTEIEKMINELNLTADMGTEEIIDRVLSYFKINREEVTEIELEVEKDHERFIDFEVKNP